MAEHSPPFNKQIVFVSHGGGPLPLLGDPDHGQLINLLNQLAENLQRPKAILVISAHWEADPISVSSGLGEQLLFDYSGFPAAAYQIQYPAKGEAKLVEQVLEVLNGGGIPAELNQQRPFDHGVFVPLKLMYPKADIPCVQLSLHPSLGAELHVKIGKALRELNFPGLLILGSGFSFHNMAAFFNAQSRLPAEEFTKSLQALLCKPMLEEEREQALIHWQKLPNARYCHPRAEHLLPLHICYAAAGCAAQSFMQCQVLNQPAAIVQWS